MASRKSKSKKNSPRPKPRPANAPLNKSTRGIPEQDFAGLKPKASSSERIEDIAVFSNVGREQLADEWKLDCAAVSESLQLVSDGEMDAANERLKSIARSSPYADWRLFVRGLCAFYSSDFETARENWKRLDSTRRPSRIAATLALAEFGEPLFNGSTPPRHLVSAAKVLLHCSEAVAAAKAILAVKHRDPQILFSPSQVAMLNNFRDDFRRKNPEFVARFSQACVYLASTQPMPDAFIYLRKSVPGPAHDPNWNLQEFNYMGGYSDVETLREEAARKYIDKDLPKVTQLSPDQKGALASCILTELADVLTPPEWPGLARFLYGGKTDYKKIADLLNTAIKKYPTNRTAHRQLLELIERQVNDRQQTKASIKAAETRLVAAKANFVDSCPNEVELCLELVDHYFNNDELDKADALVKQLSKQRVDSPLAKALPWKLQMLNAMHKSRKKSELKAVKESLVAAQSLWPTWLAPTWLPFLQAALELRRGDRQAFESLDDLARKSAGASEIEGDTMLFAAMQQLNVAPADIKPYRDKLTGYLNDVEQLPLGDLIAIGAFFWDLTRAGIEHKGFRLQASKFGKTISSRLRKREKVPTHEAFISAVCFVASRGFWQSSDSKVLPPWANEIAQTEPKVFAAFLSGLVKARYSRYELYKYGDNIKLLEEAARTEKDSFYRHYFESVTKTANEISASFNQRMFPLAGPETSSMNPIELPVDDLDDDLDDECDCPDCTAKRAQAKQNSTRKKSARAKPAAASTPLFPDEVFSLADDDAEEDAFDFMDAGDDESPLYPVDTGPNATRPGDDCGEPALGDMNSSEGPAQPTSQPKTAAEKQADLKKRRRELEKKRR